MSFDYKLFDFLQSLPKETKEEIINSIHKQYYEDRGSAAKNAKIMYQWLKENKYKNPNTFSLDHIKEFISKTLYGEYFPERIPEYDNEDGLKQLELMRDAIDKRIQELQEEQFNNDIWEHQQREQKQLINNYDDLYINNVEAWNKREGEQLNLTILFTKFILRDVI